jgi:hypothetical protein
MSLQGEVASRKTMTMAQSACETVATPVATMVTPEAATTQPRHGEDDAESPLIPLHAHGLWHATGDTNNPGSSDVAVRPTARRAPPADANFHRTRPQKHVPLSYMYDSDEAESDDKENSDDDTTIDGKRSNKHGMAACNMGRPAPSPTSQDPPPDLTTGKQSEFGVTSKAMDRVVVNLDKALADSSDAAPSATPLFSAPQLIKKLIRRVISSDDGPTGELRILDDDVPFSQLKRRLPRSGTALESLNDTRTATVRKPWDLELPSPVRVNELAPILLEEPYRRLRKQLSPSEEPIPQPDEEEDLRASMAGRPPLGSRMRGPRRRSRRAFRSDDDNDDD